MDIAYQVVGDGPLDLLVMPGPFIPIDTIDAEPSMYRFHRRLASFSRVIRFDQRGIGLSSRVPSMDVVGPTFWAEDAIAVMDAVGCEQATIFASGYTGMSGLVLAADYPERVRSLVIVNGAARTLWAPDYPIGAEGRVADPFMTVAHRAGCGRAGLRRTQDRRAERRRRQRLPHVVGSGRQPRGIAEHGPRASKVLAAGRRARQARAHHRADADRAPRQTPDSSPSATAATSPSTSRDHATSNYPAPTRCTGWATPRRCSTRSRSSSPARGAASTPNACSPRSCSPTSSARPSAPPHSATTVGATCSTATTASSATNSSASADAKSTPPVTDSSRRSPAPASRIDCAEAIVDAVRPLGIEVRVGIHAGEVEVRGEQGHRRHGRAHRRARRRAGGAERGARVVDGARDRHRITPHVRRARRARTQGRAGPLAPLRGVPSRVRAKPLQHIRSRRRRTGAGSPTA